MNLSALIICLILCLTTKAGDHDGYMTILKHEKDIWVCCYHDQTQALSLNDHLDDNYENNPLNLDCSNGCDEFPLNENIDVLIKNQNDSEYTIMTSKEEKRVFSFSNYFPAVYIQLRPKVNKSNKLMFPTLFSRSNGSYYIIRIDVNARII